MPAGPAPPLRGPRSCRRRRRVVGCVPQPILARLAGGVGQRHLGLTDTTQASQRHDVLVGHHRLEFGQEGVGPRNMRPGWRGTLSTPATALGSGTAAPSTSALERSRALGIARASQQKHQPSSSSVRSNSKASHPAARISGERRRHAEPAQRDERRVETIIGHRTGAVNRQMRGP